MRGRIDIRETLKRSLHGSVQVHCEFQQLTHDLEDNQILLWTLYQTSRAPLQRPEVIRAVRQAYRVLSGTVDHTPKYGADCVQSRPQESEQDDKWSFCLTAGTLCPANQERQ